MIPTRFRQRFLIGLSVYALALPVQAQTLGGSCNSSGASANVVASGVYSTLVCDGTTWQELNNYTLGSSTTPATSLNQIGYDSGSCTAVKTGRLSFNASTKTLCYCSSSVWTVWQGTSC